MKPLNATIRVKPLYDYLEKQRQNERFYHSIEITATFALISFFLFFAIRPTAYTISSLVGEIKSKELLVKSMRNKIGQVVAAQESFSQIQQKNQIIEECLPETQGYYHAYSQIVGNAQISLGLIPKTSFSMGDDSQQPTPIKKFGTKIDILTNFPLLVSFVENLQTGRRLTKINKISLTINKDKNTKLVAAPGMNISCEIDSTNYYWQENNVKK